MRIGGDFFHFPINNLFVYSGLQSRQSKNVDFLSTFIRKQMSTEESGWSKKAKSLSTQFVRAPKTIPTNQKDTELHPLISPQEFTYVFLRTISAQQFCKARSLQFLKYVQDFIEVVEVQGRTSIQTLLFCRIVLPIISMI